MSTTDFCSPSLPNQREGPKKTGQRKLNGWMKRQEGYRAFQRVSFEGLVKIKCSGTSLVSISNCPKTQGRERGRRRIGEGVLARVKTNKNEILHTNYPAMVDIIQKHLSVRCNTLSITLFLVLSAGVCERGVGDQYWRRWQFWRAGPDLWDSKSCHCQGQD